jgi:hypothetical protein
MITLSVSSAVFGKEDELSVTQQACVHTGLRSSLHTSSIFMVGTLGQAAPVVKTKADRVTRLLLGARS